MLLCVCCVLHAFPINVVACGRLEPVIVELMRQQGPVLCVLGIVGNACAAMLMMSLISWRLVTAGLCHTRQRCECCPRI